MDHTRAYLSTGGDPTEVHYNCYGGDVAMCHKYDINMVCQTSGGSSRCKCRDGTKWNWETKECQVFMVRVKLISGDSLTITPAYLFQNVDCSNVKLTAPKNTTIPLYSTKILSDIFPNQVQCNETNGRIYCNTLAVSNFILDNGE